MSFPFQVLSRNPELGRQFKQRTYGVDFRALPGELYRFQHSADILLLLTWHRAVNIAGAPRPAYWHNRRKGQSVPVGTARRMPHLPCFELGP